MGERRRTLFDSAGVWLVLAGLVVVIGVGIAGSSLGDFFDHPELFKTHRALQVGGGLVVLAILLAWWGVTLIVAHWHLGRRHPPVVQPAAPLPPVQIPPGSSVVFSGGTFPNMIIYQHPAVDQSQNRTTPAPDEGVTVEGLTEGAARLEASLSGEAAQNPSEAGPAEPDPTSPESQQSPGGGSP